MKLLVLAVSSFVLHGLIAFAFYLNYGPVVGPNADAGAIGWTPMFFIDFPLLWLLEESVSNHIWFMVLLILLGGLEWSLISVGAAKLCIYLVTE